MKHRSKRLLGILLSLVMVLVPGMNLTAYAATETYTNLKFYRTVVKFNNHDWYIIKDDSTATGGTVTLLAADTSFGKSVFSSDGSNAYSSSTVKSVLDALTAEGGDFASVKDAIADTNLNDVGVTGAKLYLLSAGEIGTYADLEFSGANNGGWWTRTSEASGTAAYVIGARNTINMRTSITSELGVRPALKLDLSKVTFDSTSKNFSMPTPYPLWVGGTQVTSANANDVFSDGKVSYNPGNSETNPITPATLTLNGYSYEGTGHNDNNEHYGGIFYNGTESLKIQVNGINKIVNTHNANLPCGIYSTKDVTINGTGTLEIEAQSYIKSQGIWCDKAAFSQESGNVIIKATSNGIYAKNGAEISGGSLNVSGSYAITGDETTYKLRIGSSVEAVVISGTNGATDFPIINAVPGNGWTDTAGTEGKTFIPISTSGQTLTYKRVQFPVYEVIYKVVNGTWSDDTTTDKTETVQSGSKPANVPTGMKASEGYIVGAWDTNPAETTITGATTFTYTFTAKSAATVTKAPSAPTAAPTAVPTEAPEKPLPKTGDNANPALWLILTLLALSFAAFLLRSVIRKENR